MIDPAAATDALADTKVEEATPTPTGAFAPGKIDVFISYRIDPDQKVANALKRLIETSLEPAPGVFVSGAGGLVPSNITYGGQLSSAARSASCFVGIMTSNSKSREWINFEAGAAWGRDVFYAPLLVDIDPGELPSTIGAYQAIRSREADDVKRLLVQIAGRIGRDFKTHFGTRYAPFHRVVQAYPEDPANTELSLDEALEALRTQKPEAAGMFDELIKNAVDEHTAAKLRVVRVRHDKSLKMSQICEKLDNLDPATKEIPEFYGARAEVEERKHKRVDLLRAALARGAEGHFRREAICAIAEYDYYHGRRAQGFEALRKLALSADAEDRACAIRSLIEHESEMGASLKRLLRVAILDAAPSSADYEALSHLTWDDGWYPLISHVASLMEERGADGFSANLLGITCQRAQLTNMAFVWFAQAAERGVSVAKVNMARLQKAHGLAAPGLHLLERHDGGYDAAIPAAPHEMRAELQAIVFKEQKALDELIARGKQQFELLAEFAELALSKGADSPIPSGKHTFDLAGDSMRLNWENGQLVVVAGDSGEALEFLRQDWPTPIWVSQGTDKEQFLIAEENVFRLLTLPFAADKKALINESVE